MFWLPESSELLSVSVENQGIIKPLRFTFSEASQIQAPQSDATDVILYNSDKKRSTIIICVN